MLALLGLYEKEDPDWFVLLASPILRGCGRLPRSRDALHADFGTNGMGRNVRDEQRGD